MLTPDELKYLQAVLIIYRNIQRNVGKKQDNEYATVFNKLFELEKELSEINQHTEV